MDNDQPNMKMKIPITKSQHRNSVKENVKDYDSIFRNNAMWAARRLHEDPNYFINMNKSQSPKFLWIGCSDSRVPANDITGTQPGEIFVQRNIANLVIPSDINVQSVIAYAVCHLKVHHILVVGHYGCGGVKHAIEYSDCGFLNAWLTNVQDVCRTHAVELKRIKREEDRWKRVVELNVLESCKNVLKNYWVQSSYAKDRFPSVKGLVYDLSTGYLKDLKFDYGEKMQSMAPIFKISQK